MFLNRLRIKTLDEQGFNLPPLTTFCGDLRTNANIRLCGSVQGGVIETTGNVVITTTARIDGTIRAKNVSIQGKFRGILRAEQVQILAGGEVDGTPYVNHYFVERGATVRAEFLRFDDQSIQRTFEEKATQLGFSFVGDRAIPVETVDTLEQIAKTYY